LWIGNDLTGLQLVIAHLFRHGIRVEVAMDAHAGLEWARRGVFQLVVLDLGLQNTLNLSMLRDLRQSVATPVAIVTACGRTEPAFQAGLLGAVAYLRKPISCQKVLETLCRSTSARRTNVITDSGPDRPDELVEAVRILKAGTTDRTLACNLLARKVADPNSTFSQFLAASTGLRLLLQRPTLLDIDGAKIAGAVDAMACIKWDEIDPRIAKILSIVEASGGRWRLLTADEAAAQVGVDASTVVRVLQSPLGLTFRRLVRAVVIRRAAQQLADGDDHVRQVGFRLG